jgi:methionine synthase II (cobalamin-independent)
MFATLAGSYPGPADVPPARVLGFVLVAQADAGLGLLSDGIVHRSDQASVLVDAWRAARDAAAGEGIELPVKLAVAGPWGARVAFPTGTPRAPSRAADAPDGQASAALSAAATLTVALAAVIAAGCPVIEIHEPAATLPRGVGAGTAFAAAHHLLLAGLPAEAHATLAITGGDAEALGAEALFGVPYRSYLFDLIAGPESWRTIARAPGDRGIIVGVADATGRRSPGLEEVAWAASYAASLGGRGLARVGLAPSGGLDGLDPARAQALIGLLGEAARLLAGDPEELQRRFDPRAIDLRSAALGEYRPDPRGRPRGR